MATSSRGGPVGVGRAEWLREARAYLRSSDPVLARLIADRPDFDPRRWMTELPRMDLFGALLFQLADAACTRRGAACRPAPPAPALAGVYREGLPDPAPLPGAVLPAARSRCPGLRLITMTYRGFDHQVHTAWTSRRYRPTTPRRSTAAAADRCTTPATRHPTVGRRQDEQPPGLSRQGVERLATAAAQAGVDVTLQIGEGLPHVYQLLLGTPEAAEATERIGKFLRTPGRLIDND